MIPPAYMRFASAISIAPGAEEAVAEVLAGVAAGLGGESADVVFLFVSPHHVGEGVVEDIVAGIAGGSGARAVIGCTGEGVIGDGVEHERRPAIGVLAGKFPGSKARLFALSEEDLEPLAAGKADAEAFWQDRLGGGGDGPILLLADPFTFDAAACIASIDLAFPGAQILGGMASGGTAPGQHRLFLGEEARDAGAVGLRLSGPFRFRTVVSQGCRPIGRPFVITGARENVIQTLAGRPAMAALQEVFEGLPEGDKKLAQTALQVGRVIDEQRESFGRGDFLIRDPVGFDPRSGAIAVGDLMKRGQTIQFHVRDAQTADDDLKCLLAEFRQGDHGAPAGALLFSCNGRGTRLFGSPGHDSRLLREALGDLPMAGFFCAGEIGPIGGRSFLHGFTSSIGVFSAAPE